MIRPLLLDKLIIDGVQHDDIVDRWTIMSGQDGYGVRRTSNPTLDGNRVVTVLKPPAYDPLGFTDRRTDVVRAYEATWTANQNIIGMCLKTQLDALYATQRPVWIQYDDEMSRDINVPDTLIHVGTYRAYLTNNFPVFPQGYIPGDTIDWTGHVFVNGIPISTNSFTVDQMTGTVTFTTQLQPTDIVQMFYTWRAYVQVAMRSIMPMGIAATLYSGTVLFETVTPPVGAPDPWNIQMPCQFPQTLQISATPTVLASNAVNATEEGWTYGVSTGTLGYTLDPTLSAPSNPLITSPSNLSAPSAVSKGKSMGLVTLAMI